MLQPHCHRTPGSQKKRNPESGWLSHLFLRLSVKVTSCLRRTQNWQSVPCLNGRNAYILPSESLLPGVKKKKNGNSTNTKNEGVRANPLILIFGAVNKPRTLSGPLCHLPLPAPQRAEGQQQGWQEVCAIIPTTSSLSSPAQLQKSVV